MASMQADREIVRHRRFIGWGIAAFLFLIGVAIVIGLIVRAVVGPGAGVGYFPFFFFPFGFFIFVFFLFFLFRGLFWGWGGWGWRGYYPMYGRYHYGHDDPIGRTPDHNPSGGVVRSEHGRSAGEIVDDELDVDFGEDERVVRFILNRERRVAVDESRRTEDKIARRRWPRRKWARPDLDWRPSGYQPDAPTGLSYGPAVSRKKETRLKRCLAGDPTSPASTTLSCSDRNSTCGFSLRE